MKRYCLVLLFCMGLFAAHVSAQNDEPYAPDIDPANFVEGVEHPYFTLTPGTTRVYESQTDEGLERIEVSVLPETRDVMGISCVVVRDTVWLDGELIEDTFDWYAQDSEGNVWYMGEDTHEYEDGVAINSNGAWEAGVDGALPGIVMMADPQVGTIYRQEYYAGVAEDMGEVARVSQDVSVVYGDFNDVLVIREWNPLDPGVVEEKSYAPGIGLILEEVVEGGTGRVELIDIITRENRFEDDAQDDGEDDENDEADDGVQALSGTPLISEEAALQAAQGHAGSGEADEIELDYENGRWVYSVEIGAEEITVDAITGEVLSTEADD
jgi:uncharacterized membrane protein YkoI